MIPAAREHDNIECPDHGPEPIRVPKSHRVLINRREAVALADYGSCPQQDLLGEGASLVLMGGVPAVGVGHKTTLAARVGDECSPDVFIGGPTFSLPANVTIEGGLEFKNKVIRDLYFLSTTNAGRVLLDDLARTGRHVTIKPLRVPREVAAPFLELPLPSFLEPAFEDGYGSRTEPDPPDTPVGEASDVTIYYDPDHSYSTLSEDDENTTTTTPQTDLFHEFVHAEHYAEGTALPPDQWASENPVPRYPMREEEARTIGRGPWEDAGEMTENTLRDELGLPRRDHIVASTKPASDGGPTNLRPGD